MSSTTQPTTFQDLYTALLNAARNDTGTTATVTQARRYINTALLDMHVGFGEKFPWAERTANLITHPLYSDGTALVSQGSAIVIGSGTAWTSNNALGQQNVRPGGKLRVESEQEVYEVATVTAAGSLTTSSIRVGADDLTATYSYYEDEYALASDFLRPIDVRRFTLGPHAIELVGRSDFYRLVGQNFTPGRPKIATLIDKPFSGDTTPVRKVVLYPAPDQAYQIPYRYVTANLAVASDGSALTQMSDDTDEPIVPLRYRHAIVFHALYHWYRDRKDDTRSQEAKGEYIDLVTRMSGDTEVGSQSMRISPRVGAYRMRARRPWGGGRQRYDVNGAFDRLEDLRR